MINRLLLSLKKAADTSEVGLTLRNTPHAPNPPHDLEFARISDENTAPSEGDVTPTTVLSSHVSVLIIGSEQKTVAIS